MRHLFTVFALAFVMGCNGGLPVGLTVTEGPFTSESCSPTDMNDMPDLEYVGIVETTVTPFAPTDESEGVPDEESEGVMPPEVPEIVYGQMVHMTIDSQIENITSIDMIFRDAEGNEINRCNTSMSPYLLSSLGDAYAPRYLPCFADRVAATVEVRVGTGFYSLGAPPCAPAGHGRPSDDLPGDWLIGQLLTSFHEEIGFGFRAIPAPLPTPDASFETDRTRDRCIYELPQDEASLYPHRH